MWCLVMYGDASHGFRYSLLPWVEMVWVWYGMSSVFLLRHAEMYRTPYETKRIEKTGAIT